MGKSPIIGRHGKDILPGWIVEGIVKPGNHPGGVAERWMACDVLHLFSVDPDLPAVLQTLKIFAPSQWNCHLFGRCDGFFNDGFHFIQGVVF
jgi:hypothetical protein